MKPLFLRAAALWRQAGASAAKASYEAMREGAQYDIISAFLEKAARINLISGRGAARFMNGLESVDGIYLHRDIAAGVHWSDLRQFWNMDLDSMMPSDAMAVFSTQRIDVIKAARRAIGDEFKYHRTDVLDGYLRLISYENEILDASFDMGWEVR